MFSHPGSTRADSDWCAGELGGRAGETATAYVCITVLGRPVGENDEYEVPLGPNMFSIEAPGLLGNDDSGGATVALEAIPMQTFDPPGFSFTLNADGSFTFRARATSSTGRLRMQL